LSKVPEVQQLLNILGKLVGFDTTSCKPNAALIDFIRAYLAGYGVESEIIASDDGTKACLWATVGQAGTNGIVLAGHTDVVPVTGQKWTSDPFTLTERDGKLFGRGSADMKGFIACALAFVPEFLAAHTGGCFHLALTCDEETDMSGAQRLTDVLSARGIKPEWVWVGEPTGLKIVDQHKGVSAYRTRIKGVPAHSGQPDGGLNAIELTAQLMNVIWNVAQQKKEQAVARSRFDPPYTTFNFGMIAGGTAENIIAEDCELLWQVRVHPGEEAKSVVADIENQARKLFAPRFAAFAPKAGMQTCTCFDIPPFRATTDNAGADALKKQLKCDETQAVGFATEAGIFQKLGAPAVICGPGFIEQAHQGDEFIELNQLTACVDLMHGVLLSSSARKVSAFNRSTP
jgi:acetylornithine deacetylase